MKKNSNLYLSSIEKEDMVYLYQWFADCDFLKYYDYMPPVPKNENEVNKTFNDYENKHEAKVYAIRLIENNQIIGVAGFDDIITENKVATLFIGIGSKELRGKGYGKETLKLLLNIGFCELDFYRIQLNDIEFNYSAISLYESIGFKKEGVFRKFVLRGDKRYNLYLYGLLKDEWKI